MTTMNIENNNETVKTWKDYFAENISQKIGFPLKPEMIFSDEKDWDFYISKNSLQVNSPLLLMNYMGELMAILPERDYHALENKEKWPYEYIPKVKWFYGQYLDNMHSSMDVFWQPLENGFGIRDTKKISRYLQMLKCRIDFYRTTQMPSDETCQSCEIQNCPFSKLDTKRVNSDWNKEVQERDYRVELFDAVRDRIESELGLEVIKYTHHSGNRVLLFMPSEICETTRGSVELQMPIRTLNFLMYNPVYRNWQQYAKSYLFELQVEGNTKRVTVGNELKNPAEYCREKFEILCSGQMDSDENVLDEVETTFENVEEISSELAEVSPVSDSAAEESGKKTGKLQKLKNFLLGKSSN